MLILDKTATRNNQNTQPTHTHIFERRNKQKQK